MQYGLITLACSLMSLAIFGIVTASMAIGCYNGDGKGSDTTEVKYFIANIGIASVFLIAGIIAIFFAYNKRRVTMPQIVPRTGY